MAQFRSLLCMVVLFGLAGCRATVPAPPVRPDAEKPSQSDAVRARMKRYRVLAEDLAAVEKTSEWSIFTIDGAFYAQGKEGDEIVTEVCSEAWKNDQGSMVFWRNAHAVMGKIVVTPEHPGEIRFSPQGQWKARGGPANADDFRTRISVPVKGN